MAQESRLLLLPPELRNAIYRLALAEDHAIRIDVYGEWRNEGKDRYYGMKSNTTTFKL